MCSATVTRVFRYVQLLNRLRLNLREFRIFATLESAEATNQKQQQQQHEVHADTVQGHQQIIQENEQFALGWLKATFELSPGIRIEQEELYKKYLGCCTKIGRRGVIAPSHFPKCVRYGKSIQARLKLT